MKDFMRTAIVAASLLGVALFVGRTDGQFVTPYRPVAADRDKTGTITQPAKSNGSQALNLKALASRVVRQAEGMGFEPTTPCGASDFESHMHACSLRPPAPYLVPRWLVAPTPIFRHCPRSFVIIRPLGYKVATRNED